MQEPQQVASFRRSIEEEYSLCNSIMIPSQRFLPAEQQVDGGARYSVGGDSSKEELSELGELYAVNPFDILCNARGKSSPSSTAGCNRHPGNQRFHLLVESSRDVFQSTMKKAEKSMILREIVYSLRFTGANFVVFKCGKWYDIGNRRAIQKAWHILRRKRPENFRFASTSSSHHLVPCSSFSSKDCSSTKLSTIPTTVAWLPCSEEEEENAMNLPDVEEENETAASWGITPLPPHHYYPLDCVSNDDTLTESRTQPDSTVVTFASESANMNSASSYYKSLSSACVVSSVGEFSQLPPHMWQDLFDDQEWESSGELSLCAGPDFPRSSSPPISYDEELRYSSSSQCFNST